MPKRAQVWTNVISNDFWCIVSNMWRITWKNNCQIWLTKQGAAYGQQSNLWPTLIVFHLQPPNHCSHWTLQTKTPIPVLKAWANGFDHLHAPTTNCWIHLEWLHMAVQVPCPLPVHHWSRSSLPVQRHRNIPKHTKTLYSLAGHLLMLTCKNNKSMIPWCCIWLIWSIRK